MAYRYREVQKNDNDEINSAGAPADRVEPLRLLTAPGGQAGQRPLMTCARSGGAYPAAPAGGDL